MSSALHALGRWAYRARILVVLVWVGVLAVLFTIAGLVGTGTNNTYAFPGTESQDALDALARTFPQFSGTSAQLIAVAPEGGDVTDDDFESAVEDAITAIEAIPQVSGVSSPYDGGSSADIASDSSAVLVTIQLSVGTVDVLPSTSDALQAEGTTLQGALPDGSQVAVGGSLYSQVNPGIGISELTSILIALVVLIVTFGSLVAAGMPITTALVGVGAAVAVVLTATRWLTITSTAPLLAVMLGLAVGVDYSLFIVSRHQDQVKRGMPPDESAPRAVATAGSAVMFAATTVIIALLGLSVARIPFLTITGLSAALAVATAALVALTLTPALLSFAGWHVVPKRYRPGHEARETGPDDEEDEPAATDGTDAASADAASGTSDAPAPDEPVSDEPAPDEPERQARPGGFFGHWVRAAIRWPPVTVVLITALLALAAMPAANLRLALPDSGSLPEGAPGRVTYDLIAEHFGAGANGPLILTGSVIQSTDPVDLVDDIAAEVADVQGVAAVPLATPNETGDTAVIQVIPDGAPDSEQTEQLVHRLRGMHDAFLADYAVDLSVTGYTALGVDISERLGGALLPFGLLVVGLSLVLLAMVFRSIVVPVTAALGYVLSIGAAFGLTSLVFVDGVLAGPLNVESVGSVTSFMPIIVMGVLFGLAMDYEVFLVSRMREDFLKHGEPRPAIERGFHASARVVTAAGIIMFTVFGGFILNGEASMQPIAFGLATGVAIDAFIVRMTLTPAVLAWFGRHAWWFPAGLDRVLPHFDVEGEGLAREDELADWPEPGDTHAIVGEGVAVRREPRLVGLDVRVPAGEALVVAGATPEERRAVLLALTGRRPVVDGRLKCVGLVLPVRARSVRARSAVVEVASVPDPIAAVVDAAADGPELLAIDGIDLLADPAARDELAEVLTGAARGAERRTGRPLTVLVSCELASTADAVLPHGLGRTVLEPAASARPAREAATTGTTT
ncbi:membrane protein [Agromyces luteolus]|uniref:MMPL family transporter n=1 Tax=Agromyces luteolus TaxID=88373 RepID=A0A7C9HG70_9MICO|nr:MMPL family transporter [Agromyces luteolus]MUN06067.1 MMPL family transporter [Agromyces luteolus]GLK28895.1 membrane protein [Agromyces luteolus]